VTLTVTLAQSNRNRYGFQLTAITDAGNRAGDLTPNDNRTQTQINPGNQRQYINHTLTGVSPSSPGQGVWSFKWKAPAQSVGRITFYVAGNAANGDFSSDGDAIYTTSASIQPGLPAVASVSAASFAQAPLSSDAIAAAFGTNLSNGVLSGNTSPLPTMLDGTELIVRDAAGMSRNAGLFIVSPGQINYYIPPETSQGLATITVRRNGADAAQGTLQIDPISPGLFSANSSGQGVAAAVVLRRRGTVDTFEPVSQFNATSGRFEAVPINLGPETDQVFLLLFGTAFRSRTAISAVTCTIGGVAAPPFFAGAAPGFFGLDQANLQIPRSLAGRGNVDVVFTADNKQANIVTINVQ
jgi:uncharacterized protein (TIGR03437 family)